MENTNIRLFILLVILLALAVLQIYFLKCRVYPLSLILMLFNGYVIVCYLRAIINNVNETK
jgi:hypothetical protein